MTPDPLLSRLKALGEKATPAPWRYEPGGGHAPNRICGSDSVQVSGWKEPRGGITNASYSDRVCENLGADELPGPAANIALIVALRNAWPLLLSRLERAEKMAEALEFYADPQTWALRREPVPGTPSEIDEHAPGRGKEPAVDGDAEREERSMAETLGERVAREFFEHGRVGHIDHKIDLAEVVDRLAPPASPGAGRLHRIHFTIQKCGRNEAHEWLALGEAPSPCPICKDAMACDYRGPFVAYADFSALGPLRPEPQAVSEERVRADAMAEAIALALYHGVHLTANIVNAQDAYVRARGEEFSLSIRRAALEGGE